MLRMARRDPAILQALAWCNAGIVPETLLMAALGKAVNKKAQAFARKPIGSGSLMLRMCQAAS